jgi:hypothetical protein
MGHLFALSQERVKEPKQYTLKFQIAEFRLQISISKSISNLRFHRSYVGMNVIGRSDVNEGTKRSVRA